MQFIDLAAQQQRIRDKIEANIQNVLSHGKYIMGPEIRELEKKLANYVDIKHAVGCSSGTEALLLSLMAFGVGRGDAVFTTPFTFIATAEVISLVGATPVFVDIEENSFNIDPEKLEKAIINYQNASGITPKGIIAVDLFGRPADYDAINAIAKKHNLIVIEDAAQSFGAEYKGKMACSLGDIGCTSFFPAKPLGCYGDGGMCFTNNDEHAEIMQSLRVHGKGHHKYDNVRIGINGRLDTIQAAILLAKFSIFPEEVDLRQKVAQKYFDFITDTCDIIPPSVPSDMKSVWAQYSVLAKDENHRAGLQKALKENGIPTAIYYPKPLHIQKAFEDLAYKQGDFPISEDYAKRIFSLPMHPYLDEESQKLIVKICSD
ncbi:UDP-2-acetamido-2-deoxy-3-oxo-D-glucuronate aminotransferase [Candidatus Magnetomoraceae bacterium gMMP-15]